MQSTRSLLRSRSLTALGRDLETSLSLSFTLAADATGHVVEMPMPGVRTQDIAVQVDEDSLSVSVALEREIQRGEPGVIVAERHAGAATRTLCFAEPIDTAAARASMENGMLRIVLPRGRGGPARRLELQATPRIGSEATKD